MSLQGKLKVITVTASKQFKNVAAEFISLHVSSQWKVKLNEHVLVYFCYEESNGSLNQNTLYLVKGVQPVTSLFSPGKKVSLLLHEQSVIHIKAI